MMQQSKALATELDEQCSISRTHSRGGELSVKVVFYVAGVLTHMHTQMPTRTHTYGQRDRSKRAEAASSLF